MANQPQGFRGREVALTLFGMAMVLAATLYFSRPSPALKSHPLEGKKAPEIQYEMETGEQGSLSKQKGNAVLLNFWASWCQPCLDEMPALNMLEEHFRKKGLIVLAFNLGEAGDNIQGKIKTVRMPQHLIFNYNKASLDGYGLNSLPQSVLIDRTGTIVHVYNGPVNWMEIGTLQEIEALLK